MHIPHAFAALTKVYSASDYMAAQRIRTYAHNAVKEVFSQVDVMISPTTSFTAFPVPKDIDSHGNYHQIICNLFFVFLLLHTF